MLTKHMELIVFQYRENNENHSKSTRSTHVIIVQKLVDDDNFDDFLLSTCFSDIDFTKFFNKQL